MEVTAQKPNFFYQPQGIALAVLVTAFLWTLFPGDPFVLVLLAVVIIFLYGLKRPVWAMAALLVTQLTITSFMVVTPLLTISLRLLLLLLIGIIIWRSRAASKFDLGPKAKRVVKPALILLGLSVASNLIYSGFDFVFQDLRNMLVGVLIIIFIPAVIKNLKHLKILCGVAFIVVTASAIVAVLQHFQFLGLGQNTIIPGFLQQWGDQLRVPGMSETELELSYILPVAFLAVIGVLLARREEIRSNKRILLVSLVLMVPALYFTYTRSALFALLLGLVALVLFLKTRIRGEVILSGLLLGIIIISSSGVMESFSFSGRDEASQEESSISRKILWQAGLAIAMDNPVLGIGGDQYKTVSPQYIGSVDPSLLQWEESRYFSYRTLGSDAVHNDFLHIWVSYGTLALAVFVWLYFSILRNFLIAYQQSKDRFVKGLSIGLAAGLVAYSANAFYHNCLVTIPLLWIIAGFSLATVKLAVKGKGQAQISQVNTGNRNS